MIRNRLKFPFCNRSKINSLNTFVSNNVKDIQSIVYNMTFYIYNFDENCDVAMDVCKHDVKDCNTSDLEG